VPYQWVPKEVITATGKFVIQEPDWLKLPQMPYMEFYQVSILACFYPLVEARRMSITDRLPCAASG
jgi:hypothetical protein